VCGSSACTDQYGGRSAMTVPIVTGVWNVPRSGEPTTAFERTFAFNHIVVLCENRSFDNMLGLLYSANGDVSPGGQPFDGLAGCCHPNLRSLQVESVSQLRGPLPRGHRNFVGSAAHRALSRFGQGVTYKLQ
jgi:hypothetical protein